MSYKDIFIYNQEMKEAIAELVPNQFLVEEDLQNVFSFFRSTDFTPTVHHVLHKKFKGFFL